MTLTLIIPLTLLIAGRNNQLKYSRLGEYRNKTNAAAYYGAAAISAYVLYVMWVIA